MKPGALFTDVLSVKSGICESYEALKDKFPHVELISVHPMFAPAAGWEQQNCAVIQIRAGDMSREFCRLVETWGSTMVLMESGKEHDRVTAAVQNATHAALLTFGLCLKKLGYDADMAHKMSTPPHRHMFSCIQRMAHINEPDTYWDIQTDNPNAEEVWGHLESSVSEIHAVVKNKDREKFGDIIHSFKDMKTSPSTDSDSKGGAY